MSTKEIAPLQQWVNCTCAKWTRREWTASLSRPHRGGLVRLLDMPLPSEAIEPSATGVGRFARRFGFLEKPVRIRLRLLDPPC